MKLWYRTLLTAVSDGDYTEHQVIKEEFCCKEMEDAWGEYVRFDDGYRGTLQVSITHYAYEDYNCRPIKFCPWCKEPVEAIESVRIRKVPKKVKREIVDTEYDLVEIPKGV